MRGGRRGAGRPGRGRAGGVPSGLAGPGVGSGWSGTRVGSAVRRGEQENFCCACPALFYGARLSVGGGGANQGAEREAGTAPRGRAEARGGRAPAPTSNGPRAAAAPPPGLASLRLCCPGPARPARARTARPGTHARPFGERAPAWGGRPARPGPGLLCPGPAWPETWLPRQGLPEEGRSPAALPPHAPPALRPSGPAQPLHPPPPTPEQGERRRRGLPRQASRAMLEASCPPPRRGVRKSGLGEPELPPPPAGGKASRALGPGGGGLAVPCPAEPRERRQPPPTPHPPRRQCRWGREQEKLPRWLDPGRVPAVRLRPGGGGVKPLLGAGLWRLFLGLDFRTASPAPRPRRAPHCRRAQAMAAASVRAGPPLPWPPGCHSAGQEAEGGPGPGQPLVLLPRSP